ncbi:MAG: hypothetical protein ABIJ16_07065 [Bacteroidota bacterium]
MRILILPVMLLCIYSTLLSQNPLDDFSFQVYYKTTSTDTLVFDSICTKICKVTISDTNLVPAVHVKIGTSLNGNDVFDYGFQYDVTSGLPAGMSYTRDENEIYLGLYTTTQSDLYFYEVWLEGTGGTQSVVKKWH